MTKPRITQLDLNPDGTLDIATSATDSLNIGNSTALVGMTGDTITLTGDLIINGVAYAPSTVAYRNGLTLTGSDVDIDVTDTNVFSTTGAASRVPVLNSASRLVSAGIDRSGTLTFGTIAATSITLGHGSIPIELTGTVTVNGLPIGGDESTQDAIGAILANTATIDLNYDDSIPSISASLNDNSVTNTKLTTVSTQTLKGRVSSGTGVVEDLTMAQARSALYVFRDGLIEADGYVDIDTSDTEIFTTNGTPLRVPVLGVNSELISSGVDGYYSMEFGTVEATSITFGHDSIPIELTGVVTVNGEPVVTGNGNTTVNDLATLAIYNDADINDGDAVSVASLLDSFRMVRDSSLTANGITIVTPLSGVGRWVRVGEHSSKWQNQATWFIDAVSGNDENDGYASGVPIKTQAEWVRRTGGKPLVPMSIVFQADTDETMIWDITNTYSELVSVYGGRGSSLFTGTIASSQNINSATGTDGRFTDASIPVSWTDSDLVGKLAVLTSGAYTGFAFWIAKDLGAKTARISYVNDGLGNFEIGAIADGDTYTVHQLVKLTGQQFIMSSGHGSALHFYDIEFGAQVDGSHQHHMYSGSPFFFTCKMFGFDVVNTGAPQILGGWVSNDSTTRIYEDGAMTAFACEFPYGVTVHRGMFIPEACTSHGSIILENIGAKLWLYGSLGIFDSVNGLTMATSTEADLIWGRLWGTGVTGTGVTIGSGAKVIFDSTLPINITTPTTQVDFGVTTKLYSELPFVAGNDASAVEIASNTDAQFDAITASSVSNATSVTLAAPYINLVGGISGVEIETTESVYVTSTNDIILNATGTLSVSSSRVRNVADPQTAQDAVTLAYLQANAPTSLDRSGSVDWSVAQAWSSLGAVIPVSASTATLYSVSIASDHPALTLGSGEAIAVSTKNEAANLLVILWRNASSVAAAVLQDGATSPLNVGDIEIQFVDSSGSIQVQMQKDTALEGTGTSQVRFSATELVSVPWTEDTTPTIQLFGSGYTAGDGLTLTGLDFDIDLTDTTIFSSSGAASRAMLTDASSIASATAFKVGASNHASAGGLRLSNNTAINGRDAANTADRNLISIDGNDTVAVGDYTEATQLTGLSVYLGGNTNIDLEAQGGDLSFYLNTSTTLTNNLGSIAITSATNLTQTATTGILAFNAQSSAGEIDFRIAGNELLVVNNPATTQGKFAFRDAASFTTLDLYTKYDGEAAFVGGPNLTGISVRGQAPTSDKLASAVLVKAADATSFATATAANKRGGAIILEAGRGKTPGTDPAGPIYVGLGETVSNTVANGMVFGYGAAVGTPGAADYVPFTSEIGRIRTVANEFALTGPYIRISATTNGILEGNAAYVTAYSGPITLSSTSTASLTSTGGAAYIMAPSTATCSTNGGNIEHRSANRVTHWQNYNASETRASLYYPTDTSLSTDAATTIATVAIDTARPAFVRGSIRIWDASMNVYVSNFSFSAKNIAGTVTVFNYVEDTTVSGLATCITAATNSGANAIVQATRPTGVACTASITYFVEQ